MKFSKVIIFSMFCLLLMNTQCDDDGTIIIPCGLDIVIDNEAYNAAESDSFTIPTVEIDGDCITLNVSASGCDGSTWVFTLIDSEDIEESLPPQRTLKLTLSNNEACLAVFTRAESFDLTPLRIDGVNEVVLNIEDFPEPLTYTY